jgi:hypothetical protein
MAVIVQAPAALCSAGALWRKCTCRDPSRAERRASRRCSPDRCGRSGTGRWAHHAPGNRAREVRLGGRRGSYTGRLPGWLRVSWSSERVWSAWRCLLLDPATEHRTCQTRGAGAGRRASREPAAQLEQQMHKNRTAPHGRRRSGVHSDLPRRDVTVLGERGGAPPACQTCRPPPEPQTGSTACESRCCRCCSLRRSRCCPTRSS